MRVAPLVLVLTFVAACHSCTLFAPDAARERSIGGHRVVVTAEGTRRVGVDGAGAPHAFGVLWPVVEGYGFELRIRVDDRPEVELGTARFEPDRMPTRRELDGFVATVEVGFSPDGQHLVYRRDATTGWRLLHLLPRGRPFDAADSDRFAHDVVPLNELPLASVPPTQDLALAILRDDGDGSERHRAFWDALAAQPAGAPWDEALLARWPRDPRADEILVVHARPRSGSTDAFRDALVAKGLGELDAHPRWAERIARVVVATERDVRIRELEARLAELWPIDGIAAALVARLEATREDPSRARLREAVRSEALAVVAADGDPSGREREIHESITVVVAIDERAATGHLVRPLAGIWPISESGHDFLVAHFEDVPEELQRSLGERALPLVADSSARGRRAKEIRCLYAASIGRCEEVQSLTRFTLHRCSLPERCR